MNALTSATTPWMQLQTELRDLAYVLDRQGSHTAADLLGAGAKAREDTAFLRQAFASHSVSLGGPLPFADGSMAKSEGLRRLVSLAMAVPERKDAARASPHLPFVPAVGRWAIEFVAGGRRTVHFLGELMVSLGRFARGRAPRKYAGLA